MARSRGCRNVRKRGAIVRTAPRGNSPQNVSPPAARDVVRSCDSSAASSRGGRSAEDRVHLHRQPRRPVAVRARSEWQSSGVESRSEDLSQAESALGCRADFVEVRTQILDASLNFQFDVEVVDSPPGLCVMPARRLRADRGRQGKPEEMNSLHAGPSFPGSL